MGILFLFFLGEWLASWGNFLEKLSSLPKFNMFIYFSSNVYAFLAISGSQAIQGYKEE